ncbi:MAG TPA: hypothetical protein VGE55_08935 [Limnobacter sp.]
MRTAILLKLRQLLPRRGDGYQGNGAQVTVLQLGQDAIKLGTPRYSDAVG